ncbi:MAG: glycosyltransferase family 4 protein [Solirubrobacteraceae bacterium]
MRILIASDHYSPFIGGVQRQTRALALQLQARGHKVGVATVWQEGLPSREDADGFPIWRLRQLRSLPLVRLRGQRWHQPPFPDPVTVIQLHRVFREFRPDLVHSSGWFSYSAAAALIGKRTPLIVSAREYGFICAKATLVYENAPCVGPELRKCVACAHEQFGTPRGLVAVAGVRLSKPLLRRKMAALHSVSHYVREVAERDLLDDRMRANLVQVVIPSFRTDTDQRPDPAILARLPDEPFILFVGALRRVKGLTTLFAAYRQLVSPPPLVLLGTFESDTPTDLPPEALALGGASYATVLAAWDRSLFGVMPSLWPEPFGSVVHEAMSRGKAVIGTYPGGHADMIEQGQTGLLVAAGDAKALADAMRRLVDDPEFREGIGRRARARAADFSAEAVIPQFERLYERFTPSGPVLGSVSPAQSSVY